MDNCSCSQASTAAQHAGGTPITAEPILSSRTAACGCGRDCSPFTWLCRYHYHLKELGYSLGDLNQINPASVTPNTAFLISMAMARILRAVDYFIANPPADA